MIAIGLVIVLVIAVLAMTGTPILPILAVFGGMIGVFVVLAGVVYGVSVWRNRPERSTAPQRTQKRKRALLSAGKEILPRPLRRVMPVILMWFAFMAILHYGAPDAWEAWYGNKRAFWISQGAFLLLVVVLRDTLFAPLAIATSLFGFMLAISIIEPSESSWLKWPQWPEWEEGASQAPQAKDGTQRRERQAKEVEERDPTEGKWELCFYETEKSEGWRSDIKGERICFWHMKVTEYVPKKRTAFEGAWEEKTPPKMRCSWQEGNKENHCRQTTPAKIYKILRLKEEENKKGEKFFKGAVKNVRTKAIYTFNLHRNPHASH